MRRQLSLFVSADDATAIEAVRRVVDPVQQALIPAHVTLARDDEVGGADWRAIDAAPLMLTFGAAEAFGGHGLWLPCIDGESAFRGLRDQLLGTGARTQAPHVTLAHPRNPRAPGNAVATARQLPSPLTLTFAAVHLIEQAADAPWRIVRTWTLRSSP